MDFEASTKAYLRKRPRLLLAVALILAALATIALRLSASHGTPILYQGF